LYGKLVAWRKIVAEREGKAGSLFHILQNTVLKDIAAQRPTTTEALSLINGIGKVRLEKYGADILNEVKEFQLKYSNPQPTPSFYEGNNAAPKR
jgi:superfamily II DNA helicase RecQ